MRTLDHQYFTVGASIAVKVRLLCGMCRSRALSSRLDTIHSDQGLPYTLSHSIYSSEEVIDARVTLHYDDVATVMFH